MHDDVIVETNTFKLTKEAKTTGIIENIQHVIIMRQLDIKLNILIILMIRMMNNIYLFAFSFNRFFFLSTLQSFSYCLIYSSKLSSDNLDFGSQVASFFNDFLNQTK